MRKTYALLAIVALSGCASSSENLQRATAMSIPGHVRPNDVAIFDVQRGMMDVSWAANAGGLNYACSADDMVRRPYCSPSGR